ncbi:MAG: EAL domain-containing protein [Clostridiales bacterium]|nr:EAL domain-containing protein [Clostridiales bacterium]
MKIKRKTWKEKMDIEKMSRHAVRVLIVFSVVIMGVLGYSLVGMWYASADSTTNYVQSMTKKLTDMVDLEIRRGRQQVISVGDSFEQVVAKKDDAAVEEFITRKQKLCGFDFIVLEDTRESRTAMAGTIPDEYKEGVSALRNLDTSRKALEEEICEVGIENEDVIYAMPLEDEQGRIGMIWAGNTAESMRDIIHSSSFEEGSYSCIINKNGSVVLSSDKREAFQNLESVFKKGENEKLQKNLREMERNIVNDKSGIFNFVTINDNEVYLAYTPMETGRWVLLSIITKDLLSTEYNRFVYMATFAVIGTMLVFMYFYILLMRMNRMNRQRLEQLAYTDEVTGGGNNQDFCKKYRELYNGTEKAGCAIALVDVVNFKAINKKFGMKQGDEILRYLYNVICKNLDKKKGEFAARSEMDRFFLCLKEESPESVQQRLDDITREINFFEGTKMPRYQIFFRMAATFAEERDSDPIVLQDRVRSMLKIVDAAPGKCVFYSEEFEKRVRREQELNEAFENALVAEEFHVYFQPKVSLKKEKVEGAEALVRWIHPKWGIVSPGEFIPVLEGNGKILRLDKYVFEKVCVWLKKRQSEGEEMFPVSVNLSRSNLLDENFFDWFVETADRYGVRHDLIEFELTESTFMVTEQIQQMRGYIAQMHDTGFRISIDDFGTGYSSISLLREFDLDVLKLDRTFFLGLDDPKARDVIHCLVELARNLDTRVVVEGIETKKQIEYLKELKCDVVQGFFFSRPLPAEEFEKWYREFDFKNYDI